MNGQSVAWWVALILLVWPVQYLLWIPLVIMWAIIRFAFTLGFVGILLLVIPVVGWIVLFFMLMGRRREKRYGKMLERATGEKPVSVWRPWLLDRVRS